MSRTVSAGSTLTVSSGTTEEIDSELINAGTVATAGTIEVTGGLSEVSPTDATGTVRPAITTKRFGRRQVTVIGDAQTLTAATGRSGKQEAVLGEK
jgi:hypothetical protein